MKYIKKIIKWIGFLCLIPIIHMSISFMMTAITIAGETDADTSKTVYLSTNGVHLDIVLKMHDLQETLQNTLLHDVDTSGYIAFGWGDENFYLHTPTWDDLTFSNAFSALFLKSSTLMHVTKYTEKKDSWVAVAISEVQLKKLNAYIANSFQKDAQQNIIKIEGESYGYNDVFYKATGSYSCLKTCNTWVNQGFKESKIKACLWTPFDYGLLNKHKQ